MQIKPTSSRPRVVIGNIASSSLLCALIRELVEVAVSRSIRWGLADLPPLSWVAEFSKCAAKLWPLGTRGFSNKLAGIPLVRGNGGTLGTKDQGRGGPDRNERLWGEQDREEAGTTMRLGLNNAGRVYPRTWTCLRTFDAESAFVNSLSFAYFVPRFLSLSLSCSLALLPLRGRDESKRWVAELMKFFMRRPLARALRDPNNRDPPPREEPSN